MTKPFSQACANNQQPIFDVIYRYMSAPGTVVEIGSGTGQHAVFMAARLPEVVWQPTDIHAHLPGIEAWRVAAQLPNVLPALAYDVRDERVPFEPARYVFSANTLHIMSWETVVRFFAVLPQWLLPDGYAFLYGPFNYNGRFTSDSNARFDQWLKMQARHQGIRDFSAISVLAEQAGLVLVEDHAMPANNRTLVWQRRAGHGVAS